MSSFFRNPNDVTESEDQTSDDEESSEDTSENPSPLVPPTSRRQLSNGLRKVQTVDSTSGSSTARVGSLSRQLSQLSTAEDGVRAETQEWLMRALLEDKCLNDALADLNASGQHFSKDDSEVQALAKAKYDHMSNLLGRANILPAEPERRDSASRVIRQQARDGLEYLATTSPGPSRPAVMHRDSSLINMNSGLRDLIVRNAQARAVTQAPLYENAALTHSMEAVMGLPTLLRPLVDHPMFELSRYLREFEEIAMIGKGGYGRVYHVKHRLDGSSYAIKKIHLNANRLKRIQDRGQAELDSLLVELRSLAKFDHPNIVRYYGGWLEYSTPTVSPTPKRIDGKLLLEGAEGDVGVGADRTDVDAGFIDFATPSEGALNGPKRGSIDILFERSGGEILGDLDEMDEQDDLVAELQPQIKATRKRANSSSTTASAKSKMSSVHSVGQDDDDDIDHAARGMEMLDLGWNTKTTDSVDKSDTDISSTDSLPPLNQAKSTTEPVLTLHIQMALHPLSLADYLAAPPPGETALRHCFHLRPSLQTLLSIIDGVQYLHDSGVVHRDLKPNNVFLTLNKSKTSGCIDLSTCRDCKAPAHGFLGTRIGDFGLVTEIAHPPAADHTAGIGAMATPGKMVGTELYRPQTNTSLPNEQLDVYALGIILIELLLPFATRMERQQMLLDARAGTLPPQTWIDRFGSIGEDIASITHRMLCHSTRAISVDAVRDGIEHLLRSSQST